MNRKDLLFLSIFTLLTVIAWIIFDAYHAATTSTITTVEEKLMEPLNPHFNQELITRLREKNF